MKHQGKHRGNRQGKHRGNRQGEHRGNRQGEHRGNRQGKHRGNRQGKHRKGGEKREERERVSGKIQWMWTLAQRGPKVNEGVSREG